MRRRLIGCLRLPHRHCNFGPDGGDEGMSYRNLGPSVDGYCEHCNFSPDREDDKAMVRKCSRLLEMVNPKFMTL